MEHILCWRFTVFGKWRRYYGSKTKLIAADKQNWGKKKHNYKCVCYSSTTDSTMDLSIHSTVPDFSELQSGHPQITTYKGAFQSSANNFLISFYRHPNMNGVFYLAETSHIYVSAAKHNGSRWGNDFGLVLMKSVLSSTAWWQSHLNQNIANQLPRVDLVRKQRTFCWSKNKLCSDLKNLKRQNDCFPEWLMARTQSKWMMCTEAY